MSGIGRESERMSLLVDDLLLLARLDEGRPLEREPVDLERGRRRGGRDGEDGRAVAAVDLDAEPRRRARRPGPAAPGRRQPALERARAHARRCARPRARGARTARRGARGRGLGPGLADEEVEQVFERFYRADPSRARASGGVGPRPVDRRRSRRGARRPRLRHSTPGDGLDLRRRAAADRRTCSNRSRRPPLDRRSPGSARGDARDAGTRPRREEPAGKLARLPVPATCPSSGTPRRRTASSPDVLRGVREEIRGRCADVVRVDLASERRALLDDRLHRREAGDRARGERSHRAGRDRVDADVLLAEVPGQVANGRVQRRLGDAHHVVVRHGALAAEVGHGHDRPAAPRFHQRLRRAGARDERIGADVEREPEVVARGVGEPAFEILGGGIGDRVDEQVEPSAERLPHLREHAGDVLVRADVARGDERTDTLPASSRTFSSMRSPWNVNASSAPSSASARAIDHAIERLLATPRTSPCFPSNRPAMRARVYARRRPCAGSSLIALVTALVASASASAGLVPSKRHFGDVTIPRLRARHDRGAAGRHARKGDGDRHARAAAARAGVRRRARLPALPAAARRRHRRVAGLPRARRHGAAGRDRPASKGDPAGTRLAGATASSSTASRSTLPATSFRSSCSRPVRTSTRAALHAGPEREPASSAPQLRRDGASGAGIKIGIVDDGVDQTNQFNPSGFSYPPAFRRATRPSRRRR